MGRLIQETAEAAGDEIMAALGRSDLDSLGHTGRIADVVMDFSRPETLPEICAYVRRTGTPQLSISFTTGTYESAKAVLQQLHDSAFRCMLDSVGITINQGERDTVAVSGTIVFFEYQANPQA